MKRPNIRMSRSATASAVIALAALVLGLSGVSPRKMKTTAGEMRGESDGGAGLRPAASVRYRIDSGHSRFTVRAFAGGLLSFAAHNHNIAIRDFTGDADITYGTVEPASLNMRVKADSLAVTDKISDDDRKKIETTMRNDVLETSRYPDIVFQSTGVSSTRLDEGKYQVKIPGNLTLHGATHSVTLNARLDFGTNEFHAVGEFPIRQSEFGIKPVSVAGGTIKVKDEVRLSFDITARK
jgi:polyisoprenoid-binding protein YceI